MSLQEERDSIIRKLFAKHNLGSLPPAPWSNEAALSLTNRIKSRLTDLQKDLDDKKVIFPFFYGTQVCMLMFTRAPYNFFAV